MANILVANILVAYFLRWPIFWVANFLGGLYSGGLSSRVAYFLGGQTSGGLYSGGQFSGGLCSGDLNSLHP